MRLTKKLAEIYYCYDDGIFYIKFKGLDVCLPITKVEEFRRIISVGKEQIGYLIAVRDARIQANGKYNLNSFVIIEKPKKKSKKSKKK